MTTQPSVSQLLAGVFLLAGCGADPVTTGPISNVFAASNGGVLTGSSRLPNAARIIDGLLDEANGTAFGDDGDVGDVVSADVQTAGRATATSLHLRAAEDGDAFARRRSIGAFRLEADTNEDGTYETLVFDRTVPADYGAVPGNAAAPGTGELDLTVIFAPVTSRRWRFSATQGFDSNTPFDGPRVREVELYATQ